MAENDYTTKVCPTCKRELSVEQFYNDRAKRDGLSSSCKKCNKERNLHYRKAHPEYVREKNRRWAKAHPETTREHSQRWRKAHRKEHCESVLRYRKANPEAYREYQHEWFKANREAHRVYYHRRRALKLQAGGTYTPDDINRLKQSQKYLCVICHYSIEKDYHVDHIQPLSKGGSNDPSNLQLLCPSCNLRKGAKDPIEFMQENGFLL